MSIDAPTITLKELKKVIITGCHLHQWQGEGNESIKDVFREQGTIQLDPLNPAGRNHDVFLFSRIKNYTAGEFENTCYHENLVYEDSIPNTSAIFSDYAKLFHFRKTRETMYHRTRFEDIEKSFPSLIKNLLDKIKEYEKVKASDLAQYEADIPEYKNFQSKAKQQGYWDRNILKYLGWAGEICVVGRDEGFKKIYGLTKSFFDEKKLSKPDLSPEEIEFQRLQLKLRSYPVITEKLTRTPKGTFQLKSKHSWLTRIKLSVEDLVNLKEENNRCIPTLVHCEEIDKYYIVPSNWKELEKTTIDNEMRAIAPLDPSIYDRELVNDVYSFEYSWEVYKRKKDRQWGYYVYPLLYNGAFIGRLEAKYAKNIKTLHFFNYQQEKRCDLDEEGIGALRQLCNRWKNMIGAVNMIFDKSIPSND
ncbi:MAG: DNA glycosylase AlkZ-like family protein [Candidatus Hodarchaeota archaeon]